MDKSIRVDAPDALASAVQVTRQSVIDTLRPFHGSSAKYVEEYSRTTGLPEIFSFSSLLFATSAYIGKGYRLNLGMGDSCIYPHLWGVIVAPPSSGKSPALSSLMKPLKDYDEQLFRQAISKDRPHNPLYMTKATPEAICQRLSIGDSVCVYVDEFRAFLDGINAYSQTAFLTEMLSIKDHSSFNWSLKRQKDDKWTDKCCYTHEPNMPTLGTMQDSVWAETFGGNKLLSNGFTQRFLFAYSDKRSDSLLSPLSAGNGSAVAEEWGQRMLTLTQLNRGMESTLLNIGGDARAIYQRNLDEVLTPLSHAYQEQGKTRQAEGIQKMTVDILRLAMVFHALSWLDDNSISPVITAEEMQSACQASLIFVDSFDRLMSMTQATKPNRDESSLRAILTNVRSGMSVAESAQAISMGQSTAYKVLQRNGYAPDGTSLTESAARPYMEQVIIDADWCRTQADRFYEGDAIKLRSAIRQMDATWAETGKNDHPSVQEYKSHIFNCLLKAKKDDSLGDYLLDYKGDVQADADYISNLLWGKPYRDALTDDGDELWSSNEIASIVMRLPHGQYYYQAQKTYESIAQTSYRDVMARIFADDEQGDRAIYEYLLDDMYTKCTPLTESQGDRNSALVVYDRLLDAVKSSHNSWDALAKVLNEYNGRCYSLSYGNLERLRKHCLRHQELNSEQLADVLSGLGIKNTPVHQRAEAIKANKEHIFETIKRYYPDGHYPTY